MTVFVITHDQGVDGGRAVAVRSTQDAAIAYVEEQMEFYPKLKRQGTELFWDSLGDSFFIEEFEVV